jgi:hypothetical protein
MFEVCRAISTALRGGESTLAIRRYRFEWKLHRHLPDHTARTPSL